MFGQKDKPSPYIPVDQLTQRDLRKIAQLTHGTQFVNTTNGKEVITGITYAHETIVFDPALHIVEIQGTGGSREFPSNRGLVHQSQKDKAIIFLLEEDLGHNDEHETRRTTTKVSISSQGTLTSERLFHAEPTNHAGNTTEVIV